MHHSGHDFSEEATSRCGREAAWVAGMGTGSVCVGMKVYGDLAVEILPSVEMCRLEIRPHCRDQVVVCRRLLFE